jgi:hypothetical protein
MNEVMECEVVAERVALGEPVGDLQAHIATCRRCERLVAMPAQIATATSRPDPGLGFSARMTIGAQQRLVVRRRRRIAGTSAAAVAVAAIGVFVLTRTSPEPERTVAIEPQKPEETPIAIGNSDLAGLVRMADTHRARRASAKWGRIQRPIAPYIQLVKGVEP